MDEAPVADLGPTLPARSLWATVSATARRSPTSPPARCSYLGMWGSRPGFFAESAGDSTCYNILAHRLRLPVPEVALMRLLTCLLGVIGVVCFRGLPGFAVTAEEAAQAVIR